MTKVDRVYRVQCFYMEAEKSVRQQVAVSDINADVVTHLVPMPVCRYEVLDGGPMGAPIQFAVVGQQVTFTWFTKENFKKLYISNNFLFAKPDRNFAIFVD